MQGGFDIAALAFSGGGRPLAICFCCNPNLFEDISIGPPDSAFQDAVRALTVSLPMNVSFKTHMAHSLSKPASTAARD
jgi:hypothetical protein